MTGNGGAGAGWRAGGAGAWGGGWPGVGCQRQGSRRCQEGRSPMAAGRSLETEKTWSGKDNMR
ncbi:hypothetical protein TIFTF001_041988 [Ficus carica]|uniref:Uncharacterized protein n=1 Tax=Ficus carica TaxID=3494 RepID=A0AA87ZKV8_FICCA|nr:hypothetical protein TIFTF001_041988 [Ficus carica]